MDQVYQQDLSQESPRPGGPFLIQMLFREPTELPDRDTIRDLFSMTPYRWKTPKAGAARLEELDHLRVTAAFRVHVFRREPA